MDDKDRTGDESAKTPASGPEIDTPEIIDGIEATKPATKQQFAEVEQDLNTYERSTLKWTRTIVFVYVATAVLIGLQWYAMRGQLSETQRSNELAQRAWVLVDSVVIDEPTATEDLHLVINIKNYGLSPASQIATHSGGVLSRADPSHFEIERAYPKVVDSRMLAGPGKPFPSTFPFKLNEGDIGEMRTGARLYIVGRITYIDPFYDISHRARETGFCFYVMGKDIAMCANGNYAH